MIFFISNLILAVFWAAVSGVISLKNLLWGFLVGYLLLLVSARAFGGGQYFRKTWCFALLLVFVLYSLVAASLRLALDILTPNLRMKPGIIAVPLDARTDAEITLLAGLLSLTPGTLTLDVSPDKRTLFVHVMYMVRGDADRVRQRIKRDWERRVLELLR